MSLAAFKKTSVVRYGTKISGKGPGGIWLPQGPFGAGGASMLKQATTNVGPSGFSLAGTHRNVGGVGRDCKMSRNGTPYRGAYPMGCGGTFGTYPPSQPVLNVNRVITLGDQWLYVKPSSLSTKGMLEKKYRWIHNGQYPNYWVQPNYASTMQSDTKSQGMYVHDKTTSNMCVTDVNADAKYVGHVKCSQPNLYGNSTAQFTYDGLARNAPYGKQLHQPETSSIHTLRIQRKCTNPRGPEKPFPYATNGDACNSTNITYLAPPAWYVTPSNGDLADSAAVAAKALATDYIKGLGPTLQYPNAAAFL
jgi:hypothetical protein